MTADLANAHAARIHRDDPLIEVRETALIFGDQLRVERAGPVARDRQRHLRRSRQNSLLRIAVATVGIAAGVFVAKMLISSAFRIRSESAFFRSSSSPPLANTSFGSRPP